MEPLRFMRPPECKPKLTDDDLTDLAVFICFEAMKHYYPEKRNPTAFISNKDMVGKSQNSETSV